tara:strand:+ start:431 stop:1270 length:840 start_codon:yes stop_codon:yes gene_type:complete
MFETLFSRHSNLSRKLTQFSALFIFLALSVSFVTAQEEYEEDEYYEDDEGIFWGEEDTLEYEEDEGIYWEEEDTLDYDEDEYYEDDEEYLDEDEEYSEDEDEYYEEDEYLYGGEEEYELTDVEFAEEAKKRGYTIHFTAASPGYVDHTLLKWNSNVDYRFGIDFPLLLEMGPLKIRFGIEIATFKFENSQPVGGEFSGTGGLGMIRLPAGPSNIHFGLGLLGETSVYTIGQSFGFSMGNVLDVRFGIRSTTAMTIPNTHFENEKNARWLDGFVTFGFTI